MPAAIPSRKFFPYALLGRLAAAVLPCLVLACHTPVLDEGAEGASDAPGAPACVSSRDCATGQSCVRGTCVQATDCASRGCAAGQVCGQSGQCLALREACAAEGGCSCHIVDMAGQLAGDGGAHVMGSGQRLQPQVVFVTRRGAIINTTAESLSVSNSAGEPAANFAVHDNVVEATATSGTATLTARADTVSCEARLHNLGATPGAGRLRFYVYSAATGLPIPNVAVVVDTAETGQDAGQARPTDAAGITQTEQAIERPYTATFFAAGYVYTSFVGLNPATAFDLKVPLTALHTSLDSPDTVAATPSQRRSVDFSQYEQSELDGGSSGLHLALGGTSLPLAGLVGSLGGGTGAESFDPTQVLPPGTPSFSITLPESDMPLQLPIPGPLFLASSDPAVRANLPQKDYIDLADAGALRLPWVLGGEFGATEMLLLKGALNKLLLAKFTALQDAQTAPRDALETLVQLLPKLSLGLGSHSGAAAGSTAGSAADSTARSAAHPVDAAAAALVLRAPLRQFSDLHVPAFPADSTLDTLLVLSGANAPGLGFIPLGLGIGVDCLEGACLSPAGTFNHHVQGLNLCALGRCAAGVPPRTDTDHLAFFAAQPFAGLETQPQLTVALALGVHTLEAQTVELSGWVLPQTPKPGASDLLAAQCYLPLPQVPEALVNRRYPLTQPSAGEGAGAGTVPLHFIRFVGLEDEAQWHVFAGAQAKAFVAPPVPQSWGDFPETLYAAHLQLQLDTQGASMHPGEMNMGDLGALLQQGGGLSSFAERVRAFALRSQEISAEDPQNMP
jgi:hypothetical protein